ISEVSLTSPGCVFSPPLLPSFRIKTIVTTLFRTEGGRLSRNHKAPPISATIAIDAAIRKASVFVIGKNIGDTRAGSFRRSPSEGFGASDDASSEFRSSTWRRKQAACLTRSRLAEELR